MQPDHCLAALMIALIIGCSGEVKKAEKEERPLARKSIEIVLQESTERLMAIPGVAGVAQGLLGRKPCIKVYVTELTEELAKLLPKEIDGYPVDVQETGGFRALPNDR